MFPEIPADISALSDEELHALVVECQTAYTAARASASTVDDVAALRTMQASMQTLTEAQAARAAAAAAGEQTPEEVAAALAALDETFAADGTPVPPADGEGDDGEGGDDTDGDGEGDDEPVTAANLAEIVDAAVATRVDEALAARLPARPRRAAVVASIAELAQRRMAEQAPVPSPNRAAAPYTITAAADVPNVPMGQALDRRGLAEAMIARHGQLGGGRGGPDDKVYVAQFAIERGAERTISHEDYEGSNDRKVREAAEERESIVAAGGICAPTEGYYDQMVVSQAWRPVMDGPVSRFTVDRGGIRFNAPPSLADVTSGVGTVTAAQDLAGGAGGQKPCFAVTCAAITESLVEADFVCMQFGNFGAMTHPENVEAWLALAAAAHSRSAETNRLTDIKTASIAATAAGLTGAAREVLSRLEQQRQVVNSAARRPQDAPLESILPQWVIGLMRADLTRSLTDPSELAIADAEISAMFAERHLLVTLTPDSATGNSQVIAQEAGGVINEYPSHVFSEMFVPGSVLGLDAGTLNLGLIRDSALTSGTGTNVPGNQFRVFYENFEALAFVGPAGTRVELDMTVCPDGTYGAAKAVTCPIVT